MTAVNLPGGTSGKLQLIDVLEDSTSNIQNTVHQYLMSGYSGRDPVTIQDFPGNGLAWIYGQTDGSFESVNLNSDSSNAASVTGASIGLSTSIYVAPSFRFIYSGNVVNGAGFPYNNGGYLTVSRLTDGYVTQIPLANVKKIALGGGGDGTTLLVFINNSDNVYQLVGLGQDSIYDCAQQLNVSTLNSGLPAFDRPINAIYSGTASAAFVLNCGPECGGKNASVTILQTSVLQAQAAAAYTPQLGCGTAQPLPVSQAITATNVPVPGGITAGFQVGNTFYVVGQKLYPDGYYGGILTPITLSTDPATGIISGTTGAGIPIGDGNHFRMEIGDNNTLWIAATSCNLGEYAQNNGASAAGCITIYNMSSGTVIVEPNRGDAGGVAPIIGYNKAYTAEGGTVYAYNASDGSYIYNGNIQIVGYVNDVAYIDGPYNTGP
jgi:hypothetical protein